VRFPEEIHWLFWEYDTAALDTERHADSILARILEHGPTETALKTRMFGGVNGYVRADLFPSAIVQ
jgi:hypothetical protein